MREFIRAIPPICDDEIWGIPYEIHRVNVDFIAEVYPADESGHCTVRMASGHNLVVVASDLAKALA